MSLIKKKNYNINYMHFVTRSLGTAVSIQTIKPFPALIYLLCCHNNFLFHRGCSICTTSITCPLQFHPGWLFSILHSTLLLSEKENKRFQRYMRTRRRPPGARVHYTGSGFESQAEWNYRRKFCDRNDISTLQ